MRATYWYLFLLLILVWLGETVIYGQVVTPPVAAFPVIDPNVPSVTPLSDKLGMAVLVPWLIEQAKRSHLPMFNWISPYATRTARLLSIVGAAVATVGIIIRYDPAAETLLLTNISVGSVALLAFELTKQFAMQEAAYRSAFKENTE